MDTISVSSSTPVQLGVVPTIGRAYSMLEVKSLDEEMRIIEGIATTPEPDRMDDVVESMGAQFKLPMPLLWQHRSGEPVGQVEFAEVTEKGIPFKARIAKIDEPGELKNIVDKAWQAVKFGLARGVSIGFRALEVEPIFKGKNEFVGFRFKKWEWLELSIVTIAANSSASISVIRSIDAEVLAASGNERNGVVSTEVRAAAGKAHDGASHHPPGDSGKRKPVKIRQEARMAKKTIAEQISACEATRAAVNARMLEMMEKCGEDGVTLDAAQQEEYDGLGDQIRQVDEHLNRLRQLDTINKSAAQPVNGDSQQNGSSSRQGNGGSIIQVRNNPVITTHRNLPQGTVFTRYAMALCAANGNLMQALEIAKRWRDSTPEVEEIFKSAVAAGTTTDSAWAGPLVVYQQAAGEFIELLRAQTFLGRIPGFRRVPFNITMPAQTSGSSAQWVGEGQSKPVSALVFTTVTLRWAKVANVVVLTDELVRFSNPAAEGIVRADMVASMAEFLDEQFVDPSVTEVSNVSPASITNGAPNSAASGTTANDLRADLKTVIASFSSDNIPFSGIVALMEPNLAASLALMTNALGQAEFPNVSSDGGTVLGINIIVSDNVPNGHIVFLKPSEILVADDGNVTISVSREASLQLDSAPSEPPTNMVSLWQQNMVGLRAERYINWRRRRTKAVYYITSADYGEVASV